MEIDPAKYEFREESDVSFCRKRPELVITGTDSDEFVSTMLQESMGMALQGVLDGTVSEIQIHRHSDGKFSVWDNGALDPSETNRGMPFVELMMTSISASNDAKQINRSNYNFGIVAVNALSKLFVFETMWNGSHWRQRFQRGEPVSPISRLARTSIKFRQITFTPDDDIIQYTEFVLSHFLNWYENNCKMIHNCKIDFIDEIAGVSVNLVNCSG